MSDEVVGSSIGRLSHHLMMPADVCDGLGLDRRPWDGHNITILLKQSRPPASGPVDKSNGKAVTVTQVSLLYRFPSFILLASIAGLAIDIENRAKFAKKRPYYSLVTFSLWGQPNVLTGSYCLAFSKRRHIVWQTI